MEELTAQAKDSPHLKWNLDLRNALENSSQRMLSAIEPCTRMLILRHRSSSETVGSIRGHFEEYLYDVSDAPTAVEDMVSGSNVWNILAGWWHSLRSLEIGKVVLECMDGAWVELREDVFWIICLKFFQREALP